MITLLNLWFWFYFLIFFFAIFIAFFIPADVFLKKLKLHFSCRLVLGTTLGMVMWAWQGFIFGYLNLRFLTYLYLFIFLIFWIFLNQDFIKNLFKFKLSFRNIDYILIIIVILGVFAQLIPVWGFGLQYDKGIYLCCGNREDLILHLALSNAIANRIPPIEPGMNGVVVQNYHYWSNLVVAELTRIFHFPASYIQFQYMSFFISLFLGLNAFVFAKLINISKRFIRWLVFLVYFGSDSIFFFLLILGKGFNELKKVSSLEDGSTFLINPPRAFSFVIALAGLSFFYLWMKEKKKIAGMISVFLLSTTIGFKVYTGMFFLAGFSFLLIHLFYKKRFKDMGVLFLGYLLSGIIYFSNNASAGGLVWAPFHISNDFIVQPAFGLKKLELARFVFLEHKNWIRVLQYELIFALIFFITMCGVKILAFFQSLYSLTRLGKEMIFILCFGMLSCLFIGFFFLQQSGGANTFNFIVSFWLFLSIPAALAMDYWQSKINSFKKILFVIFIIFLSLPRIISNSYSTLLEYKKLGYRFITNQELQVFDFIKSNISKNSLFMVDPYKNEFDQSTPYVAAFADRPMFFSGKDQLANHGIDIQERFDLQNEIFRNQNPKIVGSDLLTNNINYVIFWQNDFFIATESAYFTKTVYKNAKVKVVKIEKNLLKKFIESKSNI